MKVLNFEESCQLENTTAVRTLALDETIAVSGGLMKANPDDSDLGGKWNDPHAIWGGAV